jgi:hypothetical protein
MTVQELIDELMQIEDKSKLVLINAGPGWSGKLNNVVPDIFSELVLRCKSDWEEILKANREKLEQKRRNLEQG